MSLMTAKLQLVQTHACYAYTKQGLVQSPSFGTVCCNDNSRCCQEQAAEVHIEGSDPVSDGWGEAQKLQANICVA